MKNVMKRAWEIYRTLTGNRIAKLSAALKMAWNEIKKAVKGAVKMIVETGVIVNENAFGEKSLRYIITSKCYDIKEDLKAIGANWDGFSWGFSVAMDSKKDAFESIKAITEMLKEVPSIEKVTFSGKSANMAMSAIFA